MNESFRKYIESFSISLYKNKTALYLAMKPLGPIARFMRDAPLGEFYYCDTAIIPRGPGADPPGIEEILSMNEL